MNPVFTVGHSDLELETFLGILSQAGVDAIADVRSSPYSGRAPWFSKVALKPVLSERGVRYVFLGKELGGRPQSSSLYTAGVANYSAVSSTPEFLAGIERVLKGAEIHRIALMCSERDPLQCHRFLLVAKHLAKIGVELRHLSLKGVETQKEAEARLLRELRFDDLLGGDSSQLEQAYNKRSSSAAYSLNRGVGKKTA